VLVLDAMTHWTIEIKVNADRVIASAPTLAAENKALRKDLAEALEMVKAQLSDGGSFSVDDPCNSDIDTKAYALLAKHRKAEAGG
jgi:hypothetical protein